MITADGRDDYACPACGSLRIERAETWLDQLHGFLMGYGRT